MAAVRRMQCRAVSPPAGINAKYYRGARLSPAIAHQATPQTACTALKSSSTEPSPICHESSGCPCKLQGNRAILLAKPTQLSRVREILLDLCCLILRRQVAVTESRIQSKP